MIRSCCVAIVIGMLLWAAGASSADDTSGTSINETSKENAGPPSEWMLRVRGNIEKAVDPGVSLLLQCEVAVAGCYDDVSDQTFNSTIAETIGGATQDTQVADWIIESYHAVKAENQGRGVRPLLVTQDVIVRTDIKALAGPEYRSHYVRAPQPWKDARAFMDAIKKWDDRAFTGKGHLKHHGPVCFQVRQIDTSDEDVGRIKGDVVVVGVMWEVFSRKGGEFSAVSKTKRFRWSCDKWVGLPLSN